MKRKGTIILTMLLVFVIEVCLIYTLKGKMDTLLQFTKIFSVFLLVLLAGQLRDAGKRARFFPAENTGRRPGQ